MNILHVYLAHIALVLFRIISVLFNNQSYFMIHTMILISNENEQVVLEVSLTLA